MAIREKIKDPLGILGEENHPDPLGILKKKEPSGGASGLQSSPTKSQGGVVSGIETNANRQKEIDYLNTSGGGKPLSDNLANPNIRAAKESQNIENFNHTQKVNIIDESIKNSPTLTEAVFKINNIKDPNRLSDTKRAEIIDRTLHDQDFMDRISGDDKLSHEATVMKNTLPEYSPNYTLKKVEQKIGQHIQDSGKNSIIYQSMKEEDMDKIVEEMVENGKMSQQERTAYMKNKTIVGDWVKHESPDVVHSLQRGLQSGAAGIESSFRDLSNKATGGLFQKAGLIETDEARTKRQEQEQDVTPYIEPKSLLAKGVKGAGEFTGFAVPMIINAALTRGAGFGVEAAETVPALLQFEGKNAEDSRRHFEGDTPKQLAYTTLGTLIDVTLGKMLPANKAAASILKKDALNSVSQMTGDIVTDAAVKKSFLNKFTNTIGEVAKHNAKTAGVVTTFEGAHDVVDAVFGNRDLPGEEDAKKYIKTFMSSFVSATPLSLGVTAMSRAGISPKIQGERAVNIAENPDQHIEEIRDEAAKNDEPLAITEKKVQAVRDASKSWEAIKDLPDKTEAQKEKFFIKDLEQKELDQQAREAPVDVIKSELQDKANEAYADKIKIYNGTDTAPEHETYTPKEPEQVPNHNELIQEATKHVGDITLDLYKGIFKGNEAEILKEAAQQLNASPTEAKTARKIFGDKLSDIALKLYPNEKIEANLDINKFPEDVKITNNDFKSLADKEGFTDLKEVAPRLMKDFKDGDNLEFFAERKREGTWDAKRGLIVDNEGKPWGLTGILNDKNGYVKRLSETNKTEENAIQKSGAGSVLQHPQSSTGETGSERGGMEPEQQGEEITGTRPEEEKTGGQKVIAGEEEGDTFGIRHESLNKVADKLGLKKPERGTFLSPEEQIKRGRALLQGGVDPEKVAADFKEDGKATADEISVARAHYENLTKEAQVAYDKYGKNSEEFAKAKHEMQKWQDEVIKPMGTSAGSSFSALQGETDLDTGSFIALRQAFVDKNGKEPTPAQEKTIKELSEKVKGLSKDVEELKTKITDALDKADKSEKGSSIKQKAKKAADTVRSLKASRPDTFSAATPASLVWDSAIEITAKTIEAGGEIAQAISDGIAHIKESDWYKNLNQENKAKAEKEFSDHIALAVKDKITAQKLASQFAGKKDNKFTPAEAKDIWDYAKKNYLDINSDFDQMISGTAMDLGLKPEQIRDALTTPKGTKAITDAMYKKQNERNAAIQRAKDWARDANTSPLVKFLRTIPRFFFAAKVFGHGTVGMVTHSGINIYDPVEWKRYWPVFFKQFAFAYGKQANYEKAMADLKNDHQFTFWKRNGLAVDPSERYDEYQFVTKVFEKLGKVGRVLTAGDRGFNALKVYRLLRAKALYNNLSNIEKSDPNTAKAIANLVNHSTGTVGLQVSEVANTAFFAPKLELARWNKLIADPAKMVKTFTEWGSATPAEKAAAKIVLARAGRILATYVGALAVNQGLLSASGSNQKINITNPMSSDWLKFKAGGRTIDLTGGMVSLVGFLTRMGNAATHTSDKSKNKSRKDEVMSQSFDYVSGKLSPFAGTVKDVTTHHDFQGNTLPFYDDKPMHSWNKKLTTKEYLENQQTPIPVAEFFKDLDKQMENEGVPHPTRSNVIQSVLAAALVGGTGVHIGEEPKSKTKTFTDEDAKDPTFKYFLDKGLELPNTSLSSEKVKDKATHTEKKISDYPKEIQDKYEETHKAFLKKELSDVMRKGYVYVNPYGDVATERNEEGKKKMLKDLTKEEMTKVLHIAQSQATSESKKKIFHLR